MVALIVIYIIKLFIGSEFDCSKREGRGYLIKLVKLI